MTKIALRILIASWSVCASLPAAAGNDVSWVSSGVQVTPTAAKGSRLEELNPHVANAPDFRADHASAISVSGDGHYLAILTTGVNKRFRATAPVDPTTGEVKYEAIPELSNEFIFVYRVDRTRSLRLLQVLKIPNSYYGLSWGPSRNVLYASTGTGDSVLEFRPSANGHGLIRAHEYPLNHQGRGLFEALPHSYPPLPLAGALSISPDGKLLLIANLQHDSVSLLDLAQGRVTVEHDLRPGKNDESARGKPGGSFPTCLVWASNSVVFVGSARDRELIRLDIHGTDISITARIPVAGQPVAVIANRRRDRLYVALENTDSVAILDPSTAQIIEQVKVLAPPAIYRNEQGLSGASPDALALTPDENELLVSNGGQNAIAVVALGSQARSTTAVSRPSDAKSRSRAVTGSPWTGGQSKVVGLVPTGWYPTGIASSRDGRMWYAINAKSMPGPNNDLCQKVVRNTACDGRSPAAALNRHIMQLQKAGLLSVPRPSRVELRALTAQVAINNGLGPAYKSPQDRELFGLLRQKIRHVIYIVKENHTYDQVLGDLERGNGDPGLAVFGDSITPNQHALARQFVTVDSFYVAGEGSWTGWQWSTAARTNNFTERNDMLTMAGRRGEFAIYGLNRGVNVGLATSAERHEELPASPSDPDYLAGDRDVAELDGPGALPGKGYIWDAVVRAGLTVRNYGVHGAYSGSATAPLLHNPAESKTQVYFGTNATLRSRSDPYFRSVDLRLPDFWRYTEWKREFDQFVKAGNLPNLTLMMLSGDHMGAFDKAIDGVNTPETQMADNDYAVGLIVEAVANSPFSTDTLVVALEDDAWNGFDHMSAMRSPIYIAGPYVKREATVSIRYNTVSVLRTIGELLGSNPINIYDAMAAPMSDIFDLNAENWSFKAIVPSILRTTSLPLPTPSVAQSPECLGRPTHPARYWAKVMADRDFSTIDAGEFGAGNQVLWRGLMGNEPYPTRRSEADLRKDRASVLARWRATHPRGC